MYARIPEADVQMRKKKHALQTFLIMCMPFYQKIIYLFSHFKFSVRLTSRVLDISEICLPPVIYWDCYDWRYDTR